MSDNKEVRALRTDCCNHITKAPGIAVSETQAQAGASSIKVRTEP
jgi:hypothetical protein